MYCVEVKHGYLITGNILQSIFDVNLKLVGYETGNIYEDWNIDHTRWLKDVSLLEGTT